MSDPKAGAFDAAIRCLENSYGLMSSVEEKENRPVIEAAIRFLEVAAKVDKRGALWVAQGILRNAPSDYLTYCGQVRALLAALPELKEEGK